MNLMLIIIIGVFSFLGIFLIITIVENIFLDSIITIMNMIYNCENLKGTWDKTCEDTGNMVVFLLKLIFSTLSPILIVREIAKKSR